MPPFKTARLRCAQHTGQLFETMPTAVTHQETEHPELQEADLVDGLGNSAFWQLDPDGVHMSCPQHQVEVGTLTAAFVHQRDVAHPMSELDELVALGIPLWRLLTT